VEETLRVFSVQFGTFSRGRRDKRQWQFSMEARAEGTETSVRFHTMFNRKEACLQLDYLL
jgi:hypothetical protein